MPEAIPLYHVWRIVIFTSAFDDLYFVVSNGRTVLLFRNIRSTAASFPGPPHVRVTRFGRGLLDFGVSLAADKDSRTGEVKPQQKRGHRIQFSIDPGRAEILLVHPK